MYVFLFLCLTSLYYEITGRICMRFLQNNLYSIYENDLWLQKSVFLVISSDY